MKRAILLLAVLLAGCAPQGRDIALADINLSDMETVASIRAQLSPKEKVAFANFIVRHNVKSAHFCGQPLTLPNGKAPVTVGDAVDLSIIRDAAERQAWVEAQKPKHPRQLRKEQWDNLIAARDILMDSQSRLRIQHGDKAARRSDWKSLETKMAAIDRKLTEMKPSVFGPNISSRYERPET